MLGVRPSSPDPARLETWVHHMRKRQAKSRLHEISHSRLPSDAGAVVCHLRKMETIRPGLR